MNIAKASSTNAKHDDDYAKAFIQCRDEFYVLYTQYFLGNNKSQNLIDDLMKKEETSSFSMPFATSNKKEKKLEPRRIIEAAEKTTSTT